MENEEILSSIVRRNRYTVAVQQVATLTNDFLLGTAMVNLLLANQEGVSYEKTTFLGDALFCIRLKADENILKLKEKKDDLFTDAEKAKLKQSFCSVHTNKIKVDGSKDGLYANYSVPETYHPEVNLNPEVHTGEQAEDAAVVLGRNILAKK